MEGLQQSTQYQQLSARSVGLASSASATSQPVHDIGLGTIGLLLGMALLTISLFYVVRPSATVCR